MITFDSITPTGLIHLDKFRERTSDTLSTEGRGLRQFSKRGFVYGFEQHHATKQTEVPPSRW
ncbi:hypothetical protein ACQPYE_26530 [Actinosynnema sp. CA-299493]